MPAERRAVLGWGLEPVKDPVTMAVLVHLDPVVLVDCSVGPYLYPLFIFYDDLMTVAYKNLSVKSWQTTYSQF